MTSTATPTPAVHPPDPDGYRHEALVYRDLDEYVTEVADFVREGLARGERVLVAVPGERSDALRRALPDGSGAVRFADMRTVGDNPARIIGVWSDFLDEVPGSACRGVGEPVYADRDADQIDECQRHERLLDRCFPGREFLLLCPYDGSLGRRVLDDARATHRRIHESGTSGPSPSFRADGLADHLFDGPLRPPPGPTTEIPFGTDGLRSVRRFVEAAARRAGLSHDRSADVVLAVDEIAANSVLHGGSGGTVRCWTDGDWFVCELDGAGTIVDPLVGRFRPDPDSVGGRGLWLANQLCDLVQIRNTCGGLVVRTRTRIGGA